jgi:2'-5' RNA ligase
MSQDPDHVGDAQGEGPAAERINCFALVTYIPYPLGRYLDRLRTELEPNSLSPRAHVTILPPRPLAPGVTPDQAWSFLDRFLPEFPALEIALDGISVFRETSVVFVSLADATSRILTDMHRRLNAGPLLFQECFEYHPHVTLAQGLVPSQVPAVESTARERWDGYRGSRRFSAETFTFVQSLSDKRWIDLNQMTLQVA